ncbi:MAG: hypothetical protein MJ146_01070 [Clostridia bacterium]|nr:hypothetical protein [Clostridia bacterium]
MENFMIETIVNGYCKSLIRANLLENSLYFDMEGLEKARPRSTLDAIKLIENAVEICNDLEDHLFFKNTYLLDLDHLYYNRSRKRYFLKYEEGEGKVQKLIYELGEMWPFIRDFPLEEMEDERLLRYLERKKMEAYQLGIS